MSSRPPEAPRPVFRAVTGLFLLLAVLLEGLLALYWTMVLERRLLHEAGQQARILAESQAHVLADALLEPDASLRRTRVLEALDRLLLIRDPQSHVPFFEGVTLEVDYEVVEAEPGSLDLGRGAGPDGGFAADVALFDLETGMLPGIAHMRVSDRFHERLRRDVQRQLVVQGGVVLAVLTGAWGALVVLLGKLQRQTDERGRAEQALLEHERKYRRLLDRLSNYFVYARDADGRLTFVSESVTRVLGYSSEEFLREGDELLTDPSSGRRMRAVGDGGGQNVYEVEVRDRDGGLHRMEQSEVPMHDAHGTVVGVEGLAHDVTEQKQFERDLRIARDRAEEASRVKSQFLANMSHEIRTPMNAVLGMTQLLLKTQPTERQLGYLARIDSAVRLLVDLINDILDLSKIEAGRFELQSIDFELDEVLGRLASIVGVKAAEKGIELLFSSGPDVPRVLRGDPLRLGQVLLNLTNNAVKFTDQGEIVVRVELAGAPPAARGLCFSVRDTGPGIAPEQIAKLFQPFRQLDASLTRRYGGTGLGLAISKRLVTLMGGALEVDSVPGRGSVFTFTLPFELPPDARKALPYDALRGLRVLVADDNETARLVLDEMLRSLRFEVTLVDSGEAALAEVERGLVAGEPYRLVVLDWRMPGLDGIETARRLHARPELAELPVVLITAYGSEEVMRLAAGVAKEYISKPVSQSDLYDSVLRALDVAYQPALPRPPAAAPPPPPSVRGRRLLLVEDNPINREVAQELLGAAGFDVAVAAGGLEALELLEADRGFDAVLMDVQMPGMDGLEATRRIRSLPHSRDLPVIAVTAHAMLGDRERFLAAGMSDYVSKPIDETQLLEVLGRWLPDLPAAPVARPHAPSGLGALQGVDVAAGLRRAGGNEALYRRLLAGFAREHAADPEALRRALEEGRVRDALGLAHTIKGAAATLSATRVAAAAQALEASLAAGKPWEPRLEALERTLERLGRAVLDLHPAAASGRAPPATPPVAESVEPLLHELAGYLRSGNLRAEACFEQLEAILGPETLHGLKTELARLDFESALTSLQRLAASLHLPLDGRP